MLGNEAAVGKLCHCGGGCSKHDVVYCRFIRLCGVLWMEYLCSVNVDAVWLDGSEGDLFHHFNGASDLDQSGSSQIQ